ncbi:MAG: fumarylacetoacetate hydrolase family protein [Acidobacteria bacterium]|nr:fumarylacetoacetate hydrolase family protein [Acidobacteriota bacterium]
MKLIRFGAPGAEQPGVQLEDGGRIDVSAAVADYGEAFFTTGGLSHLGAWVERHGKAAPRVGADTRLGPPIDRPSKIVCIGLNFRDHAAEAGMPLPTEPVIFFKSTTALAGPNDPVVIPKNGSKVDWEVELAIVIGTRCAYVSRKDASDFIAGYMLHNDYSERAFQLERAGQWVKGKSADTFAPIGPYLVTRDEMPDPGALDMWLKVNGEYRQKSTTANMIFDAPALVSYVSEFMTLLPGDIISSGTPAGVALGMKPTPKYLRPGDIVELGIDGLGESRQVVVAYESGSYQFSVVSAQP